MTFSVGLDGNIPQPGYIIAVADEMLAGKVNGGRTREVDGCVITLDRKTEAKAGDRLLLNLPSGGRKAEPLRVSMDTSSPSPLNMPKDQNRNAYGPLSLTL